MYFHLQSTPPGRWSDRAAYLCVTKDMTGYVSHLHVSSQEISHSSRSQDTFMKRPFIAERGSNEEHTTGM